MGSFSRFKVDHSKEALGEDSLLSSINHFKEGEHVKEKGILPPIAVRCRIVATD